MAVFVPEKRSRACSHRDAAGVPIDIERVHLGMPNRIQCGQGQLIKVLCRDDSQRLQLIWSTRVLGSTTKGVLAEML